MTGPDTPAPVGPGSGDHRSTPAQWLGARATSADDVDDERTQAERSTLTALSCTPSGRHQPADASASSDCAEKSATAAADATSSRCRPSVPTGSRVFATHMSGTRSLCARRALHAVRGPTADALPDQLAHAARAKRAAQR